MPETESDRGQWERLTHSISAKLISLLLRKARPARRIEHYWLCDACSPFVTLTFDRQRGVITVPLPDGSGMKTVKLVSMDGAPSAVGFDDSSLQPALHEVQK